MRRVPGIRIFGVRKFDSGAGLVLALLLCFLTGCSREIPEGITELSYATPYSPAHTFSRADQSWMAFVAQRSGGALTIRPIWSGALLSSEHSMIELRHGLADIGLITPIYVKGGAHLLRIQSGFYHGTREVEEQVALYRCMAAAHREFGDELAGLKVLAVQGGSLPGIITRDRPIRGLDDLRGLRLRAPTELLGILRQLGADPVNMPMGDVYAALAKGVLDGVIAPVDTFQSLHFIEVARYYTAIAVPRGAYPARAMNERRWQQLTPAQRAVLDEGVAVWEAAIAREVRASIAGGEELARRAGVTIHAVSAEDQRRFDALYLADAERNAAALDHYGIDGRAVFQTARASIRGDGTVNCQEMN